MPLEYVKLAEYFVFGCIGGLIGSMAKSRRLTLPHVVIERKKNGEIIKAWDTGFLAAPFVGGALAMVFDTAPVNAIGWGLASGYAGPSIWNALVDGLLSKFGFKVGGLPEPAPSPTPSSGGAQ